MIVLVVLAAEGCHHIDSGSAGMIRSRCSSRMVNRWKHPFTEMLLLGLQPQGPVILRSIKTLATINGKPAKDVLKQGDAKRP
jgi:hypothetical protein